MFAPDVVVEMVTVAGSLLGYTPPSGLIVGSVTWGME
jgi:hypothetical protein